MTSPGGGGREGDMSPVIQYPPSPSSPLLVFCYSFLMLTRKVPQVIAHLADSSHLPESLFALFYHLHVFHEILLTFFAGREQDEKIGGCH